MTKFRDMRAMISDYKKNFGRFPTSKEFEDKLEMSEATVKRYKKIILAESKQALLKQFHQDIIIHVEGALDVITENIKLFREIRDSETSSDEKMTAAKNLQEAHLDAVRIMNDAPEYLGLEDDSTDSNNNSNNDNNNVNSTNESEHIHKQAKEEERISEEAETLLSE